jgi:hypothetical protein
MGVSPLAVEAGDAAVVDSSEEGVLDFGGSVGCALVTPQALVALGSVSLAGGVYSETVCVGCCDVSLGLA